MARRSRGVPRCVSQWLGSCAVLLLTGVFPASASPPEGTLGIRQPEFIGAGISEWRKGAPPCTSLACVKLRVLAGATVRLRGAFGGFTGQVEHWSSDSLSGLVPDADWGGAAPSTPVLWGQIDRIDRRVSNTGSAAFGGTLIGGLLGAVVGFAIGIPDATISSLFGDGSDLGSTVLIGTAAGALLGAGVGASMGSRSSHWAPVYGRP